MKKIIKKKLFLNKLGFTFIGLILIILISIPLVKNISKRYYINKEIEGLKNEIEELESKNTEMQDLLVYLDSDEFVEEQARLKLGLKKEGEETVIIEGLGQNPSDKNDTSYRIQGLNSAKSGISNPQKWLNYYFKPKIANP